MHAWRWGLVAAEGLTVLAFAAGARAEPRCFGAASRDPEHQPCKNPALRYSVTPSPSNALITPSSICTPLERSKAPEVCWFGAPGRPRCRQGALLGDSHAVHWRPQLLSWPEPSTGTRSRSPARNARSPSRFQRSPSRHRQCVNWRWDVLAWLAHHPEVSTVFESANSGSGVIAAAGHDQFAARVSGYINAWQALPGTVQHVRHQRRTAQRGPDNAVYRTGNRNAQADRIGVQSAPQHRPEARPPRLGGHDAGEFLASHTSRPDAVHVRHPLVLPSRRGRPGPQRHRPPDPHIRPHTRAFSAPRSQSPHGHSDSRRRASERSRRTRITRPDILRNLHANRRGAIAPRPPPAPVTTGGGPSATAARQTAETAGPRRHDRYGLVSRRDPSQSRVR
jgi:hypothetical protein